MTEFRLLNLELNLGDFHLRVPLWRIAAGEAWAIVGAGGCGKTLLAEVLAARRPVGGGEVHRPHDGVAFVSFAENSGRFQYGKHYYQQRFNFIEPEDDLTLLDFLNHNEKTPELEILLARFGLAGREESSVIHLSNGQMRRARLIRALLKHPKFLILDEPFVGLDTSGRQLLSDELQALHREGVGLILIEHRDRIPEWITTLFVIEHGVGRPTHRSEESQHSSEAPRRFLTTPGSGRVVVECCNINVTAGGRPILRNINWTVRQGERWAVLGPNGCGKTTLLSLLCGDHPQAFSNHVELFGCRRDSGLSLQEWKRPIGLLSPEMHLYFTQPLTVTEAIGSGFFDGVVRRKLDDSQRGRIRDLLQQFGMSDFANRPFKTLSTGGQRLILFLRAIVKNPPLLILDEPFQGLDEATTQRLRDWLDAELGRDCTLLMTTHRLEELPRSVERCLDLG